MSVVENLNRIKSCKEDIKQAIIDKGVDMTDVAFTEFATKISEIQAGGGGGEISDFLDYKATVTTYNSNRDTIPNYAFMGCGLTSVNLPKCETVGEHAFDGTPLTSVNLPVCKDIGNYSFMNCDALTEIDLPCCERVAYGAFQNCDNLVSANLPLCKNIENEGFCYCWALASVDSPCCERVGSNGFAYTNLQSANLPACKELDYYAFYECNSLTEVNLPKCYFLNGHAFNNCDALLSVELPECNNVNEGVFNSCPSLTFADLPVCHHIGACAFEYDHALQRVNIPMCDLIEDNAFGDCTSLTELDLSKSYYCVLSNEDCFYNSPIANGNGYIYVHNSVLSQFQNATNWSRYADCFVGVGEESEVLVAFDADSGELSGTTEYISTNFQDVFGVSKEQVKTINLPNVKEISAENMFSGCSIESINLESVERIENGAFSNCSIEGVFEAPACQVVGRAAFRDSNVSVGDDDTFIPSCVEIGESAFSNTTMASTSGNEALNMSECRVIGTRAFSYSTLPPNVSLDNCETIGDYAFECSSVEWLNVSQCEAIGKYAFYNSQIGNIELENCKTIGEYAFAQCYNLNDISLPNCKYIGYGAFEGCYNLNRITLRGDTVVETAGYIGQIDNVDIHVSPELLEAYKNDPFWGAYADKIVDY